MGLKSCDIFVSRDRSRQIVTTMRMMVMVAVLFPAFMLFSMAAGQPSFSPQCDIRCQLLKDLQPIVQNASSRYNSSVSIAIDHPAFHAMLCRDPRSL